MNLRKLDYKWLVATAFVFGIFMDLMDITIVNVALPTLGRHFNAASYQLEWVVIGYLLSLAIWIPASGWIGDRVGTKKTFLFALTMFVAASSLCGVAWNIDSLIAFRVLQGVGGGMMTPVGMAMLFRAFPPEERAQASVVVIIPTILAPALGPVLGGFFVDYLSWHWIFFANLPSGLVLVLFALSRGPEAGWGSLQVLGTFIGGIATLTALVAIELHAERPMLHLRLLRDGMFRNANIVLSAGVGSVFGLIFLLSLFLQDLRGASAIDTGLVLMPQAMAVAIFAPLVGRMYPRVGPRRLMVVASLLFGATSGLMLLVDLQTNLLWVGGVQFLRGVGMAFLFVPVQTASFATIKPRDVGQASSIINTSRQVAASLGVALLATVLIARTNSHLDNVVTPALIQHAQLLAYHDAFFASVL